MESFICVYTSFEKSQALQSCCGASAPAAVERNKKGKVGIIPFSHDPRGDRQTGKYRHKVPYFLFPENPGSKFPGFP